MDLKDNIYLEIAEIKGNEVRCPIYTYISVFVVNFCQNKVVDIYFVKSNCSSEFCIPYQVVEDLNIKFTECETLPQYVKDSHLPTLVSRDNQTCVGGLCAVLRWTIKTKCRINPEDSCSSLLGFRGGCLMACSENSVWTKFVEVDMPQTVAKFQETTSSEKSSVVIPADLVRLEMHLRQPVKTHNILKRKQDFYKESKVKKDFISDRDGAFNLENLNNCVTEIQNSKQYNRVKKLNKSCSDVNLPHHFVEGVDFTLADVILLPCVHQLLTLLTPWKSSVENCLPLVLMWYKRVLENNHTMEIADLWKLDIRSRLAEDQENVLLIKPNIENESLYSRDPSRPKPRIRNRDPSELVNKLKLAGIHPIYSPFPSEGSEKIDWETLPRAVHPAGGDLPPNRIQRKCQQIESIVRAVLSLAMASCVIVDFCAGGGHVGLLIAYLLPQCKVILIENKESSMDRARARTKELKLNNVFFYQCNMDYFQGRFDIGVCLHACGVATDLVIQQCLDNEASFVCCPCCYGSIHNSHMLKYPRSSMFRKCGITYEEYLLLCHCADRTEIATPKVEQGRYCMATVDMDRYYYATENYYTMKLCTLQPPSCTPKCNLLIGMKLRGKEFTK